MKKMTIIKGVVYAGDSPLAKLSGKVVSTAYGTFLLLNKPTLSLTPVVGTRHSSFVEYLTPSGSLVMCKKRANSKFEDGDWYIDCAHVKFNTSEKATYDKKFVAA